MSLPFPEGTTALPTDSEQRSLQKINQLLLTGGGGGGGGGNDVTVGPDPDPNGLYDGAIGDQYFSAPSRTGDGSLWTNTNGTNTGWE